MWIASFCIFYMIKEQNITRLSDCEKAYPNILNDRNTHPPFPSSNPVKNSQYTDVSLYIF